MRENNKVSEFLHIIPTFFFIYMNAFQCFLIKTSNLKCSEMFQ